MQKLISIFRNDESSDARLLHFDASASVVYAEMIGFRQTMEDAMIVRQHYRSDNAFYGVFDGHGGNRIARYTADAFPALFADIGRRDGYRQAVSPGDKFYRRAVGNDDESAVS
jgi:serine/threonine protein phosphatase PrpC